MENEILDSGSEFRKDAPDDFARIIELKREYAEAEKKVKNGKVAIWVLVGFTVFGAIYELATIGEPLLVGGIYGVLLTIYIGGAIMMDKQPRVALIVVLVVYLIIQILNALGDPMSLISGLLVKGLIIYYIAIAIAPAGKFMKLKREMEEFNLIV